MKKVLIGADPFANQLKNAIIEHLKKQGYEIEDFSSVKGDLTNYIDAGIATCEALKAGKGDCAILLCGTGMGMSIVANRYVGISAAVVESVFAAKMCRVVNNANVLCLGQMIWGEWMAKEAVDVFLKTAFKEGLESLGDFLQCACDRVNALNP